jgi:hypothetical protein
MEQRIVVTKQEVYETLHDLYNSITVEFVEELLIRRINK